MNTAEAARQTLTKSNIRNGGGPFDRCHTGMGIEHAGWMLTEIGLGNITGEKAHRWLGYAQAIVVNFGYLSLYDCKNINHAA
ncbi:MAG: hypothetical protein V3W41_22585 [Planctomycetota bacterium]